jgi:hypothetical protein
VQAVPVEKRVNSLTSAGFYVKQHRFGGIGPFRATFPVIETQTIR